MSVSHQSSGKFQELLNMVSNSGRPPVEQWHPTNVGSIDIRIDVNGKWFHEGRVFQRDALVKLFSQILRRENDQYYLVTPVEKLRIEVEDVPFIAIDVEVRGEGKSTEIICATNVEDYVLVDAQHPISQREGKPYVMVRDQLWARLSQSMYYHLMQWVELEESMKGAAEYCLYSCGTRFVLT